MESRVQPVCPNRTKMFLKRPLGIQGKSYREEHALGNQICFSGSMTCLFLFCPILASDTQTFGDSSGPRESEYTQGSCCGCLINCLFSCSPRRVPFLLFKQKRKKKRLSHTATRQAVRSVTADMGGGTSLFQQDNVEHIIIPTGEKNEQSTLRAVHYPPPLFHKSYLYGSSWREALNASIIQSGFIRPGSRLAKKRLTSPSGIRDRLLSGMHKRWPAAPRHR